MISSTHYWTTNKKVPVVKNAKNFKINQSDFSRQVNKGLGTVMNDPT